jgi:hypothetical protein
MSTATATKGKILALTEMEALQKRVEALETENAELKNGAVLRITAKVGEKGGICLYGLQARRPIHMYVNQAQRIKVWLNEDLDSFIEANRDKLSFKD